MIRLKLVKEHVQNIVYDVSKKIMLSNVMNVKKDMYYNIKFAKMPQNFIF